MADESSNQQLRIRCGRCGEGRPNGGVTLGHIERDPDTGEVGWERRKIRVRFPPVPDDLDYEDNQALETHFREFFENLPEGAHKKYATQLSRPRIDVEVGDDHEGGTMIIARCSCSAAYLFRAAELEAKFPALVQRTPPAAIAGKDIGVWLGTST